MLTSLQQLIVTKLLLASLEILSWPCRCILLVLGDIRISHARLKRRWVWNIEENPEGLLEELGYTKKCSAGKWIGVLNFTTPENHANRGSSTCKIKLPIYE